MYVCAVVLFQPATNLSIKRYICPRDIITELVQLLAVDTSAITTMKNAAKRDINCELQNSVNHHNFERIAAMGLSFSYASLSIASKTPQIYMAWLVSVDDDVVDKIGRVIWYVNLLIYWSLESQVFQIIDDNNRS